MSIVFYSRWKIKKLLKAFFLNTVDCLGVLSSLPIQGHQRLSLCDTLMCCLENRATYLFLIAVLQTSEYKTGNLYNCRLMCSY